MPRRSSWRQLGLIFTCLTALAGCGKKPVDVAVSTGAEPVAGNPTPPAAAANSDYLLYAHLNAKAIRESAVFTELHQAVEKHGTAKLWNLMESALSDDLLGFKPTDLDSVTVVVPELPPRQEPKTWVVLVANKPFDKAALLAKNRANATPDAAGFYTFGRVLLHFPDDKTAVFTHPDLKQKYLDGYAKDRTGWPMTAELTKAAAGHTGFAVLNLLKFTVQEQPAQFGSLLAAEIATLTADLKGKELIVDGRATFPDAAAAEKATGDVQKLVGMLAQEVEQYTKLDPLRSREMAALAAFKPVFKEADRAVKAVKVAAIGTAVTLSGSYKADFDIGKIVADAVQQVKEAAPRISAQNNLKQLILSLHSTGDSNNNIIPIHGIGPKGVPLKDAKEKPLLSWRVAILPYIEEGTLYNQFKLDEPWDSPNNKKLIAKMPKLFAPVGKPGKPGYTHMQMVIGPSALPLPFARMPASFPDGTSNTIALVEAAEPVIWTKPDDVMFPGKELPKDFRKKFGGLFPGGFHVAMWDGSIRFVTDKVSDRTLGFALNPADGNVLGPDW